MNLEYKPVSVGGMIMKKVIIMKQLEDTNKKREKNKLLKELILLEKKIAEKQGVGEIKETKKGKFDWLND